MAKSIAARAVRKRLAGNRSAARAAAINRVAAGGSGMPNAPAATASGGGKKIT
jgi:hypothetical protein